MKRKELIKNGLIVIMVGVICVMGINLTNTKSTNDAQMLKTFDAGRKCVIKDLLYSNGYLADGEYSVLYTMEEAIEENPSEKNIDEFLEKMEEIFSNLAGEPL